MGKKPHPPVGRVFALLVFRHAGMEEQERYLKKWDVFISYASEDRDSVARPLAEGLRRHGLRVWFDKFELRVGDSLAKSINYGLANSSYGVVVLSPDFLGKKWTQKELAALVSLEEEERGRILPVWHRLGANELRKSVPILADIIAVQASIGIPAVVRELLRAINLPLVGQSVTGIWTGESGRLRLFEVEDKLQGDYDWLGHEWAGHVEGSLELLPNPNRLPSHIFKFNWWWDLSPEKGNGYFVAIRRPNGLYGAQARGCYSDENERADQGGLFALLSGTWAFDYEELDLAQSVRGLVKNRPHPWLFGRGGHGALMARDIVELYCHYGPAEEYGFEGFGFRDRDVDGS